MQCAADLVRFSPREAQVAVLVCHLLPTDQIAERLSIEECTVLDYLKAIYHALGITRREQLLAWCLSHPEALSRRDWAEIARHARGCLCASAYCSVMRTLPLPQVA